MNPKSSFRGQKLMIFILTTCLFGVYSQNSEQPPKIPQAEQINLQDSTEEVIHDYTWYEQSSQKKFRQLNEQLESLSDQFLPNFLSHYQIQQSKVLEMFSQPLLAQKINLQSIIRNPGHYLLLLGKMYLYNILPKSFLTDSTWNIYDSQSRHMLAYFYLKIAAEEYEQSQAYYYLGLLQFYKLTPDTTVLSNLNRTVQQLAHTKGFDEIYSKKYLEIIEHLKNYRFVGAESNLYFGSVLGHHGASLVLANMNREGIATEKNCTTALSYYLSFIKDTYVDFYEFRNSFETEGNFEKQLYSKKKVNLQKFGGDDAKIVESSEFFDKENIEAMYELAENYFVGRAGFRKNYKRAAELYEKLASEHHKPSMAMLALCYFKGQGVPVDRKRARVLFENSKEARISESMLLAMDLFQIERSGSRERAISKLKGYFSDRGSKQQGKVHFTSDPIIKYLLGSLIVKGEFPDIDKDEGLVLLEEAAKSGHLMSKVAMGLIFVDGIDISYDCQRAVNYFSEEGMAHPFFMDKFHMAKIGLKQGKSSFSLMKYLELTLVGHTDSFINALYTVEIEHEKSLGMNENSWSVRHASQNALYTALKGVGVVPDMHSYLIKHYNLFGLNSITYEELEKLLMGTESSRREHFEYLRKKIIRICAVTKQNSLMNFYEYKTSEKPDNSLLTVISNDIGQKPHVLQSRYLLGQYYHKKSVDLAQKGKDHTKTQYRAIREYQRATDSELLGKIIFYFEEIKMNDYTINLEDDMFQFQVLDNLMTYTFVLTILCFALYYKRSKRLDEIHKKEVEKIRQEERIQEQAENYHNQNKASLGEQEEVKKEEHLFSGQKIGDGDLYSNSKDKNQVRRQKGQLGSQQSLKISRGQQEEKEGKPSDKEQSAEDLHKNSESKGYLIGSSSEDTFQTFLPKYCLQEPEESEKVPELLGQQDAQQDNLGDELKKDK